MNPYTPSASRLFYGREEIFHDLLKDEEASQPVVFIGGRRCGKTRLLQRLDRYLRARYDPGIARDAAEPAAIWQLDPAAAWLSAIPDAIGPAPVSDLAPHWPFLVDFQGLALKSLRQALAHVAGSVADGDPPVPLPSAPVAAECDARTLEEWLKDVDLALAKERLGGIGLLLDQITDIFTEPWHHDLMSFLRRLFDHTLRSRVWIVVAGSYALDGYRNPTDGSPPLNVAKRHFLGDLNYRARRHMAVEPFVAAGRLPPADEVLRAVDRSAAGNVWLLTLMLEDLFEVEPTLHAVREAEEGLLDRQNDTFERWANALSANGWEIYSQVATHGFLAAEHIKTVPARATRNLLEYQSLVHRCNPVGDIELGPDLFRRWAAEMGKIQPPFPPRPEPKGEGGLLPPGYYRYDVALSFASPQRESARKLADQLRIQGGLRVFYDQELQHELWGADLGRSLPSVYDREAQITVLLISKEYLERHWPRIEAAAALSKALRDGWGAVLLVSVDGARLPEVPESIVVLDLSYGDRSVSDVALDLIARHRRFGAAA